MLESSKTGFCESTKEGGLMIQKELMSGDEHKPIAWLRQQMLRVQIEGRGIRNHRVLEAMESVPREEFVAPDRRFEAYDDRPLDIGSGQTISQPYIVAYMTDQLDVQPEHRVLEIGTGSGYQTAILSRLRAAVYSIEAVPGLADAARSRLDLGKYPNIHLCGGDGTYGWPEEAPFDRIMVTACSPDLPAPLVEQLTIGGKMVLPVGTSDHQHLVRVERRPHRYVEYPLIGCRFVKLIGAHGWPK